MLVDDRLKCGAGRTGERPVAGVEGNFDWTNQSASGSPPGFNGTLTQAINWDGMIVGKLGVDVGGLLPYVDAGVAFANATRTDTVTGVNPNVTHTGWTVGVGVEAMVADHLSAFVSYNYVDYGSAYYNTGANTNPTIHLTDNIVKVGLNYHF